MIRRRTITERELVLFHQGALPLGEILPFLREDLLVSHSDEAGHAGEGDPSRGELPRVPLFVKIRQKLYSIGRRQPAGC